MSYIYYNSILCVYIVLYVNMTKYVYNHVHVLYTIITQVSTQSCIMYTYMLCIYKYVYMYIYGLQNLQKKKKDATSFTFALEKQMRRLNVEAPGFGSSSSFGSSGSGGLAMKRSVLHTAPTRGDTHSGRLTTGTYKSPNLKRKMI